MEQALQAVSRDDVLAAITKAGTSIGPGERFACIYAGHRYDPKALIAIALRLTTGQQLDEQALADATYEAFNKHLKDLEFCVVKVPRSLGDESLTSLVYELKSPDIVQSNYSRLMSANQKRFYWNSDKFSKLKLGAPVFVVNQTVGKAMFGYLQKTHIKAQYSPERDISTFTDQGETFEVRGEWREFIAIDLRYIEHVPRNWRWKTLGSGEHTFLSGPDATAKTAKNNLERVNLLLEVFNDENTDVGLQLHTCYGALKTLLPEDSKEQEAEPRIWFVVQGQTFTPELGQKFLWAPLTDKRGGTHKHWQAMNDLKPGDVVVHNTIGGIKGISQVTSLPFACSNPFEGDEWRGEGIRADVQIQAVIEPPIRAETLRQLKDPLAAALADVRGPFNSQGTGNQGYLYEFTWEALAILLKDQTFELPEQIKRWLPDVELPSVETPASQVEVTPASSAAAATPQKTTSIDAKEWLSVVHARIAEQGFHYGIDEVANFYASLRTKPLVLLAGISGTGKTQLVRQFAKAIGYGDDDHCVVIPVRPDWADSSELLGYENIRGEYVSRPFLTVLERAMAHPDELYFVVLDEMNLARVEHYFAEYLSFIETRSRNANEMIVTDPVVSRVDVNSGIPVVIPQNVFVVGTVNMDETTHPFSRKVLDRANAIEMNDIDLAWAEELSGGASTILSGIYADCLVTPFLNAKELSTAQKQALSPAMTLLQDINRILEPAGLHVGYRVRDEIAFYLTIHQQDELESIGFSKTAALDFQLMQKILPRIQGSSMSVYQVLISLLNLLASKQFTIDSEWTEMQKAIEQSTAEYPRSVKKLMFMLQRFNNDGFTSFWL